MLLLDSIIHFIMIFILLLKSFKIFTAHNFYFQLQNVNNLYNFCVIFLKNIIYIYKYKQIMIIPISNTYKKDKLKYLYTFYLSISINYDNHI
jgi:hypothetical protein